jgi:hypothetical protein
MNHGYILHDSNYLNIPWGINIPQAKPDRVGGPLHGAALEVVLQLHDLQVYQSEY